MFEVAQGDRWPYLTKKMSEHEKLAKSEACLTVVRDSFEGLKTLQTWSWHIEKKDAFFRVNRSFVAFRFQRTSDEAYRLYVWAGSDDLVADNRTIVMFPDGYRAVFENHLDMPAVIRLEVLDQLGEAFLPVDITLELDRFIDHYRQDRDSAQRPLPIRIGSFQGELPFDAIRALAVLRDFDLGNIK